MQSPIIQLEHNMLRFTEEHLLQCERLLPEVRPQPAACYCTSFPWYNEVQTAALLGLKHSAAETNRTLVSELVPIQCPASPQLFINRK